MSYGVLDDRQSWIHSIRSRQDSSPFFDRIGLIRSSLRVMTEMAASLEYDSVVPVVEAVQQGDKHAFTELLHRQDRWVRGVVLGVLGNRDRVDDVSQQIWTTVWQRIGDLRDPKRWRSWLYRLARNAAVDAGRSATRRRETPSTGIDDASDDATPVTDAVTRERDQAVYEAIASLPPLYREPFVLKHVENWSYRRIAEVMELPVDTVETRLVRARRLLREALSPRL